MRGIICVNFGLEWPGWETCQRVWCGRCYSMTPGRPFLVSSAVDDDGNALPISPEAQEFSTARNGDHLLCLFECEFCIFERVGGRSARATVGPLQIGSIYERRTKADQHRPETDQRILECFRRANLDAFWSRGSETVRGNTLLFAQYMLHGERTGFQMFESPHPKERNDFGERCAMAMLLDSLEPGRDEPTVKFCSVWKVRSMVTNVLKVHGDLAAPTATICGVD
jgi:hypothetical protein